jgi:hypothetical protein
MPKRVSLAWQLLRSRAISQPNPARPVNDPLPLSMRSSHDLNARAPAERSCFRTTGATRSRSRDRDSRHNDAAVTEAIVPGHGRVAVLRAFVSPRGAAVRRLTEAVAQLVTWASRRPACGSSRRCGRPPYAARRVVVVHSTSAPPAGWRPRVPDGAEESPLARRGRSCERRSHDTYAASRRRLTSPGLRGPPFTERRSIGGTLPVAPLSHLVRSGHQLSRLG